MKNPVLAALALGAFAFVQPAASAPVALPVAGITQMDDSLVQKAYHRWNRPHHRWDREWGAGHKWDWRRGHRHWHNDRAWRRGNR